MSDLFDIVPQTKHNPHHQNHQHYNTPNYIKLQGDFVCNNYGYYTLRFIEMISKDASQKSPAVEMLSISKLLKQTAKKFMLSDLELVYLAHISNLLNWNIQQPFIQNHSTQLQYSCENVHKRTEHLHFFLNLTAYFVKKYIGAVEEIRAISELLRKQSQNQWESIYEQWLTTCPNQIFKLSPRELNSIYSRYSKNCQKSSSTKNYNKMVDQIMELSTTYSMIPGETKQNKKRKSNNPQILPPQTKNDSGLFGRKIVKVDTLSLDYPSKYFEMKIPPIPESSLPSNYEVDHQHSGQKQKKIKLGFKNSEKQEKINHNVTDFFKDQNQSNLSYSNKKYIPQSTIGFPDVNLNPNINFFDSKMFSSGQEIIPYTLRSHSNIFKSKWLE